MFPFILVKNVEKNRKQIGGHKNEKKLQTNGKMVNLQKTLKYLVNSINQLTIAYVYCKRNCTIFKWHTYPFWSIAICCYCSCWCYVYRDMTLDLHSKSHFSSSFPSSYFPSLVYCIHIFVVIIYILCYFMHVIYESHKIPLIYMHETEDIKEKETAWSFMWWR